MSCSFLIWSSLAMSANSSKKPSKLLQKEKASCWRKGESDIGNGQQKVKNNYELVMNKHLLESLRGKKVEQMKQLF